jgi:ABC-type dipeptide/oligopeptide/nickel transport system ATPase subunit
MNLLQVTHLRCEISSGSVWGMSKRRSNVLRDVSFVINDGCNLGLLGKSGSGKSTLARCIAGIQRSQGGTIEFDGRNIYPNEENRPATKLQIQLLFQSTNASLNPALTVESSVKEAIKAGRSEQASAQLLESVGLDKQFLPRFPAQLSGGEIQRVALARVLAVQPRLLILDEPTASLDVVTQNSILLLLNELQREYNFSILFITHDVRLALSFCDRVAVLHEGRIVEENSPGELMEKPQHSYTREIFEATGISFSSSPLLQP